MTQGGTTFRDNLLVQSSRVKSQDGRDRLSRNVRNLLSIYAGQHPRRENSFTPRWKPESRTSYLHSVRLIWFRPATTLATAAILKLCRNTLACREQLLDASRKIWPSKNRLVLLKVSEDDTLKTVCGLQFSPDLLIQRTQNCHRCGHIPQLSSFIFTSYISQKFWYSHEWRMWTSWVKCVAAEKRLIAADLGHSHSLLLVPLCVSEIIHFLTNTTLFLRDISKCRQPLCFMRNPNYPLTNKRICLG